MCTYVTLPLPTHDTRVHPSRCGRQGRGRLAGCATPYKANHTTQPGPPVHEAKRKRKRSILNPFLELFASLLSTHNHKHPGSDTMHPCILCIPPLTNTPPFIVRMPTQYPPFLPRGIMPLPKGVVPFKAQVWGLQPLGLETLISVHTRIHVDLLFESLPHSSCAAPVTQGRGAQ